MKPRAYVDVPATVWEAVPVRIWSFDGPEVFVWRAAGGSECHFGWDQAGIQTKSFASSSWQRW